MNTSRPRADDAARILRAAIAAADPSPAVERALAGLDLRTPGELYLVAIGKAAARMTDGALRALPQAPRSTLVVLPHASADVPADPLSHAIRQVLHASHPLPDASSVAAGAAVETVLLEAAENDVVIILLSGGASALCVAPVPGLDVGTYSTVVHALMHAGADIGELNTVRAHIDRLKGGGMARLLAPARAVGLVVSDVAGNPLDVIASGPLTPPQASPADALAVLMHYGLNDLLPPRVAAALERSGVTEHGNHVSVVVILDNAAAREGAAAKARSLGYDVRVDVRPVIGAAREAGRRIAHAAIAVADTMLPGDPHVCLVAGGETTVTVTGAGTGGRNQELVLAAALALDGHPRITIASIGTDGIDGPTDAAGAVADCRIVGKAAALGIDAAESLRSNDSHTFFNVVGGLIRTGPTGTNVMDVQVALIEPPD